ncbi:50S ribosomal protein L30 [Marispirochaeta sp.]|jgi:large subunit ribosomal protein L30|uniref:50S ribosomal protein L30 n=1 Tax=Marispirochaeta sp. TaxID=2038653 RepID=UPI0029C99AAF|nr:50S ribosomal protein L30 [Marispirochaeta sp.]
MKLRIKLINSVIGRPQNQRRVVEALGLKKLNSTVEQDDIPSIRGMVKKVSHLVQVQEIK